EVLVWLNAVDPEANYLSALDVRAPGTGNWLLRGREYVDWKEGREGVLWLYGMPGCGKSVLSATVIKDIEQLCEVSGDHAFAYFYFTFSDPKKQNLLNMLLSLIGQLAKGLSDCDFPNEVKNLYRNSEAIGKSPGIEDLKSAFSQIIKSYKKTFLILDALDEFPEPSRRSLLSWLSKLATDNKVESLSILVTSRPKADIVRSLKPLKPSSISLESKTIDPDIRSYIHNSLDGKDKFQGFTQTTKSEIVEALVVCSLG
ncbi:unnamed protein product, partial [Tuber aestivum]